MNYFRVSHKISRVPRKVVGKQSSDQAQSLEGVFVAPLMEKVMVMVRTTDHEEARRSIVVEPGAVADAGDRVVTLMPKATVQTRRVTLTLRAASTPSA